MLLGRREVIAWVAAMLSIAIDVEAASAVSLVDLSSLGKALGEAADAIGKLGDNIAHIGSLAVQGWDAASARATQERLRDISARLTSLNRLSNTAIITSLDRYIVLWDGLTNSGARPLMAADLPEFKAAWSDLIAQLTITLSDVKGLLGDLENERSDLVTRSVYQDLIETLGGRASLLKKLSHSSAPATAAEVDALRAVSVKYKALRDNLRKAIEATNAYIHDSGNAR